MKASRFYGVAAVLLVLFSVGHTLGFRQTDPSWGVDNLLSSLRALHFSAQGFNRTYYDFYVGFGLFVSVLLFFAALVAWQLAAMSSEMLAQMTLLRWAFAICFVAVTVLSWRYCFAVPVIFSAGITLFLIVATCL